MHRNVNETMNEIDRSSFFRTMQKLIYCETWKVRNSIFFFSFGTAMQENVFASLDTVD